MARIEKLVAHLNDSVIIRPLPDGLPSDKSWQQRIYSSVANCDGGSQVFGLRLKKIESKPVKKIPYSICPKAPPVTLDGRLTLRIPEAAYALGVSDNNAGGRIKRGRFYKAVIKDERGKTTSNRTAPRHPCLGADQLCSPGFSPGWWWHSDLKAVATALSMQSRPRTTERQTEPRL